ncbi:MAG: DUF58 domain-containing protein [Microcystaceae cyanobacterium]
MILRGFSPIDWLENHWVTPSYGGWLLIGLSLSFFGAATNTMAGWLYVLSGMIFSLLGISAWLSVLSLQQITLKRSPIAPVSAGEDLTMEMTLQNPSKSAKTLLQLWDVLPASLGRPAGKAIEVIPSQGNYVWAYDVPTQQRGIYHWDILQLRSGTPFGLFWCRRQRLVSAKAVVYPQILPLTHCPIVDAIGAEDSPKIYSDRRYQAAQEGITKTLRPYRYGDSTRLIHWRSSARFEEFKVRELEVVTGGQDIVICLDSGQPWDKAVFEQAVIAAASLYFYALRCQLNVKLWTAGSGVHQGTRTVLEILAAVQAEERVQSDIPSKIPLLWLTNSAQRLTGLSSHSRWLYFAEQESSPNVKTLAAGLGITADQPLAQQLQKPIR